VFFCVNSFAVSGGLHIFTGKKYLFADIHQDDAIFANLFLVIKAIISRRKRRKPQKRKARLLVSLLRMREPGFYWNGKLTLFIIYFIFAAAFMDVPKTVDFTPLQFNRAGTKSIPV